MRLFALLLAGVLCFSVSARAQEMKLGFVQVDRIMQGFPEHEDASKTYEKELESWQIQLNEYQSEIQAMEEKFQQRAMLYSPERKQEESEKILDTRTTAVKFYQDIFGQGGKAEQRKIELLTPIYDKVNRAIEMLGERDGFSMIFNAQGLLFAKDQYDLTEDVLKLLKTGISSSSSAGAPRR